MVTFTAILQKFDSKGEKTGWTYIEFSAEIAHQICPNQRTSFRVKGSLDDLAVKLVALLPMGDGDFILPINADMRRKLRKKEGASIAVAVELDTDEVPMSADLLVCLEDDPQALDFFGTLNKGHQNYFSNWIESAKTIETKTKRITMAVKGLSMKLGYPEMIRYFKNVEK